MTNILVKNGMNTLVELASFAKTNGFSALEVGPTVALDEDSYSTVVSEYGIRIAALTYCRNFLSSDEEEAIHHRQELERRIRLAGRLSIPLVVTSTGIDKRVEEGIYDNADSIRKIPERSLDAFTKVFAPLVDLCEKLGVKLAFENCPLMGNIAISPVMWKRIFSRFDSTCVGLAYDPSHLVWQHMDPYGPILEFRDRIFHFHAKDTAIDRLRLERCGFLTDFSWWRYCVPGSGEIDWALMLSVLRQIDYAGYVSIEHEDRDYDGSLENVEKGILMAKRHLEDSLIKEEEEW